MEEVLITGFGRGVPEWATEHTLREIRDYIQTQTVLARDTNAESRESRRENDNSRKNNTKTFKGIMRDGVTSFKNALIAGGASYEKVAKLMIQDLTDSLSKTGIGATIVGFGVIMAKYNDILMDINSLYLDAYNNGIALEGSFTNIIDAASDAEMSILEYTAALGHNSRTIAALSEGNVHGARVFGDMIRNVRSSMVEFGQLGMQTSEIIDYMGEYLETQRLYGFQEQVDSVRRSQSITEYLQQLTTLSQMTGKHRKQLAAEIQDSLQDPTFSSYMATLGKDVQENIKGAVTGLTGFSPQMAELFKDILQYGGPTEETAILASVLGETTDELITLAQKVKNGGKLTEKEMIKFGLSLDQRAEGLLKSNGQFYTYAAKVNSGFIPVIQTLQDLSSISNKTNKEFNTNLERIYNNLSVYTDKFFTPITNKFGKWTESILGKGTALDNGLGWIADILEDSFIPWWSELIDSIPNDPLWPIWGVIDVFKSLWKSLTEFVDFIGELPSKIIERITSITFGVDSVEGENNTPPTQTLPPASLGYGNEQSLPTNPYTMKKKRRPEDLVETVDGVVTKADADAFNKAMEKNNKLSANALERLIKATENVSKRIDKLSNTVKKSGNNVYGE